MASKSSRPGSRTLSRQNSSVRSTTSTSDSSNGFSESFRRKSRKKSLRKGAGSTATLSSVMSVGADNRDEEPDLQYEVIRQLTAALGECSRQRLLSLQMALRKASNGEPRISPKDLYTLFQEQQIKISSRTFSMVRQVFEDTYGIQYDRLYAALKEAHAKTGRDSVIACGKRNDIEIGGTRFATREQKDVELVSRLAQQMQRHREAFDLDELQSELKEKDIDKGGKLEQKLVLDVMAECTMPIYGAVSFALLTRCNQDGAQLCNWPELMGFLDRAKKNLIDSGQMTEHSIRLLKTRRQEEKKVAQQRVLEQRIRDLEAISAAAVRSKDTNEKDVKGNIEQTEAVGKEVVKAVFKQTLGANGKLQQTEQASNSKKSKESPTHSNAVANFKVLGRPKTKTVMKSMLAIEKARQQQFGTSRPGPLYSEAPLIEETGEAAETEHSSRIPRNQPLNSVKPPEHAKVSMHANRMDVTLHGRKVTFYVPDHFKPDATSLDPPSQRLKLAWAYGYNGHDCRSNIHTLLSGEIVYNTGTVIVLYSSERHMQRLYREHTHDVKCLAVHPNRVTVASGQSAADHNQAEDIHAHVRLWRSDTLQTLHILGINVFSGSVIALAFSLTKDKLVAVDNSPDHVLSAWCTSSGKFLSHTPSRVPQVYAVSVQAQDDCVVVVAGREHLGWWQMLPEQATFQLLRKAEYHTYLRARNITCLWRSSESNDTMTGDSNGTVYVWGQGNNIITNFIKHAHQGSVLCLEVVRGHILTGGKDGKLISWLWTRNMPKCTEISLAHDEGGARTIQVLDDALIVGTTNNSILVTQLASKESRDPLGGITILNRRITQGHYSEIKGVHITKTPYCGSIAMTTGVDGLICVYDTIERLPLHRFQLKGTSVVCSHLSENGELLACVTNTNQVCVFEISTTTEGVLTLREAVRIDTKIVCATVVKMSPDCSLLAIGCQNGSVHVVGTQYDEDGRPVWTVQATCRERKDEITSLDWTKARTENEYYLRASDKACRYFIWKGKRMQNDDTAASGTLIWISQNFLISYDTIGVYFCKQAQKARVNALDVNATKTLIAMGDSHGYISLFKYPCSKKGITLKRNLRHHSRVSHVVWLPPLECRCASLSSIVSSSCTSTISMTSHSSLSDTSSSIEGRHIAHRTQMIDVGDINANHTSEILVGVDLPEGDNFLSQSLSYVYDLLNEKQDINDSDQSKTLMNPCLKENASNQVVGNLSDESLSGSISARSIKVQASGSVAESCLIECCCFISAGGGSDRTLLFWAVHA